MSSKSWPGRKFMNPGLITIIIIAWFFRVTKTASNCLHKLIQINRIKHLLDGKTLILLMNCFVFSKLFYCLTVWSKTSHSNVKKLPLVQNFAARIVLGLQKFDHISQGIRSFNWLSVCDRLYLNDAIMIFKCIHNLIPDYLAEKFIFRSQTNIRDLKHRQRNARRRRLQPKEDWVEGFILRLVALAMAFKNVRNLLLINHNDGFIDDDEFVLLYNLFASKNRDFPYDSYAIDLEELDESESFAEFRFRKRDI